jgi:hypothetical protein
LGDARGECIAKLGGMRATYDRIAGQVVEWLAAQSDGVFAEAMTLLVLDLHVPAVAAVTSMVCGGLLGCLVLVL